MIFKGFFLFFFFKANVYCSLEAISSLPSLLPSFCFILLSLFIFSSFLTFICLWQGWVFVAARRLSPVVASGGSSLRCAGSLQQLLSPQSTCTPVAMAHTVSCGIFPDQVSNPRPCIGRRIPYDGAAREAFSLF